MGKRNRSAIVDAAIRDMDKRQKREWQPRGDLVPAGKFHVPKRGPYDRTVARAQNWRDYLNSTTSNEEEEVEEEGTE
jgi:hypothetical protein